MTAYICMNHQPLKKSEIGKFVGHNTSSKREEYDNVDSSRTQHNESHGRLSDVVAALPTKDQRGHKLRKDARVAAAFVFQASPGWKGKQSAMFKKCIDWVRDNHEGSIAHVAIHRDEKTPHMHVIFVPKDSAGRANYRSQFGGAKEEAREKMRTAHDTLGAAVAPLGLARGERDGGLAYGKGSKKERDVRLAYEALIDRQAKRIAELEEILAYNASLDEQGGAQRPSMTETRATHAPARRAVPEHGANRGRN